jgi:hypothetical protein
MIVNTQLTTSTASLFTAPGTPGDMNTQSAITTMIFCNTLAPNASDETVNAVTIDVFAVAYGASPVTLTNKIISSLTIPAGETLFFDTERIVLAAGDSIQASCSQNSAVVATVSVLPV